jgi:hypothetical protein
VVTTNLDCNGDEASPWRWGSWFREYYRTKKFPPEFGTALIITFNSVKKPFTETFGGQRDEDKVQNVLLNTVHAIVHCKRLRNVCKKWNDRQLYGYVRSIIENSVRLQNKENSPEWFKMLRRIGKLAKTKLKLIDRRKRIYIPLDWAGYEKTWRTKEELEARLLDVPTIDREIAKKISERLVEEAVRRLFDAAEGPIPLFTLVTQCLRILQIREPSIRSLDTFMPQQLFKPVADFFEPGTSDPHTNGHSLQAMVGVFASEMKEWLTDTLHPLSPDEHLVPLYFRICKNMTLAKTTRNARTTLGLRKLSLETVRTRLFQAADLMRGKRQCAPWFPETAEEREAFRSLLAECIVARLDAAGIGIENARDSN